VTPLADMRADVAATRRRIVGVTGCPGAGKSTYAAGLAAAAGSGAVVVPMDGFHLAQTELVRLGRAGRKGAPDTFDVRGYVALLRRLRDDVDDVVYAPGFRRDLEEPIAGAIPVEPHHRMIVTEGNYLLHDTGGWEHVRPLLDECCFLELDDDIRRARLVARHIAHGRSPEQAEAWVASVDDVNAALVVRTRHLADRVVRTGDG
jgi:pantothenate kinase